jgi:enoyl-CoA hydratase
VFAKFEASHKPVIAAVNGFALGGGCELAMACHVRIAGDLAKFGQPEVKLGFIPGYGGTQRLPRLVGPGHAAQLLLTGEIIDANEAARIGLVNRVVPAPELMTVTEGIMKQMLGNAPQALSRILDAIRRAADAPRRRCTTWSRVTSRRWPAPKMRARGRPRSLASGRRASAGADDRHGSAVDRPHGS